jgi:hypothetical protein
MKKHLFFLLIFACLNKIYGNRIIDVSSYPKLRNAPVLSGVLRIPTKVQTGKR